MKKPGLIQLLFLFSFFLFACKDKEVVCYTCAESIGLCQGMIDVTGSSVIDTGTIQHSSWSGPDVDRGQRSIPFTMLRSGCCYSVRTYRFVKSNMMKEEEKWRLFSISGEDYILEGEGTIEIWNGGEFQACFSAEESVKYDMK